jgi:beta-galactosidase/beta-glucuronidase
MKLAVFIFIAFSIRVSAQHQVNIVDLYGDWKFSIGDKSEWSKPEFDDSDWESIHVPSSWENQGFHGYDGYAWYRNSFYLPREYAGKSFILQLGSIDDVDEVYVNGNFVGRSGGFPPDYETAYNEWRNYPVPQKFLKLNSKNVIAVRVYDSQLEGGIIKGDIGLYYLQTIVADYNLEGLWKFSLGDDIEWKEPEFNDSEWKKIVVPGLWENHGYRGYDGHAWYRTSFPLPDNLKNRDLVILMGMIDDIDEVYLNGVLVGSTGDFNLEHSGDAYRQFRGYYIPEGIIKEKNNILAVRVFDGFMGGGIYRGPIGLVRQEKYTKFWKSMRQKRNIFDIIFNF